MNESVSDLRTPYWGMNEDLYRDIHSERMRAHLKHFATGKSAERMNAHHPRWLPVLTEELGEVASVLCDDGGLERLREELIQVAAMASAWIAAIDRFGRPSFDDRQSQSADAISSRPALEGRP